MLKVIEASLKSALDAPKQKKCYYGSRKQLSMRKATNVNNSLNAVHLLIIGLETALHPVSKH